MPLGMHPPLGPVPRGSITVPRTQAWHLLSSVGGESEVFLFTLQAAVSPGRKRNRESLGLTKCQRPLEVRPSSVAPDHAYLTSMQSTS